MLYAIYGTDIKKTRQKQNDLIEGLLKKRPDADVFKMSPETWNESKIDEYVSGINLFAPKNIVVLDSLVSCKESVDYIMSHIKDFATSEHVCILIDSKLTKEQLKKIEGNAEKVLAFNLADGVVKKKESPQTFALADALATRNKKRAWAVFQSIERQGVVAEEIHGVIWWQFKSIYLASKTPSAQAAGLNPYVYQKAKAACAYWPHEALEKTLKRLVMMYHKAHRGECDFMSELEILCLE